MEKTACKETSCGYYDSCYELNCTYSGDNSRCVKDGANGVNAVLGGGWRDARKEFPERFGKYLVYCAWTKGVLQYNDRVIAEYHLVGDKHWFINGKYRDEIVIAWMPLPDPPSFA